MSQVPILHTKLYIPPARRELVPRSRLIDRLNAGLHHPLTLISAPAGFGKTTLLSTWILDFSSDPASGQPIQNRASWLSLDEGDNDLVRFLAYLVAALQIVAPHLGEAVLGGLQSRQPPPTEWLLTGLLNEIAAVPHTLVLVLDDYHLIEAQPVVQALTFLVEHLPPRLHLVIATRQDPDLPLARLRVRGQLTELRAADLRFTPAEAAEFLNRVMGLDLSAQAISALEARTEGWIAGLQLAALSMQGRSEPDQFVAAFTGSHRFVLDYLVEEVLDRQTDRVRHFLLRTSILDRLSGPLCDAVIQRRDSKATLEALERGNLFVVPLDDRREWVRYHHLFADVLRSRLLEEQPDEVPALHRRAGEWYEQNGLPAEAIHHALAAGDFERAAGLIELAWSAMDLNMQSATWLGWARALPDDLIRTRPVLSLGYAWALLDGGELEACEARLCDAERWLATPVDGQMEPDLEASPGMVVVDEEQSRSLAASIATARAYRALALGDVRGGVMYAHQGLVLTPEHDRLRRTQATALLGMAQYASGDLEVADRSLAAFQADLYQAGDLTTAISLAFVLATIRRARGRLRQAITTYRQALDLVTGLDRPLVGTADLYRGLAELECERGDLDAAAQYLLTGQHLGEQAALPGWPHRRCVAEARLKQTRGDLEGALHLLDEAERVYVRGALPEPRPIAALRAQIWAAQGRLDQARAWVREQGLSPDDDLCYLREFEHMTLARVLIAGYQSNPDAAASGRVMSLLARLLEAADSGGRVESTIEILVLQALAYQAQDNIPLALASLERALALAEPEGYVQILVDGGPPMAALLREAAKRGFAPSYVRRLQLALGQAERGIPVARPLIEPLSERELDVLRLLATELSGPEIARHLVVSLTTVRTHTQHIYGKLGVNSRRAAVRRAEELDLL